MLEQDKNNLSFFPRYVLYKRKHTHWAYVTIVALICISMFIIGGKIANFVSPPTYKTTEEKKLDRSPTNVIILGSFGAFTFVIFFYLLYRIDRKHAIQAGLKCGTCGTIWNSERLEKIIQKGVCPKCKNDVFVLTSHCTGDGHE
jgi:uncharacterized membrane protein YfcA